MTAPLVEVEQLQTYFPIRRGLLRQVVGNVQAVDGVSFSIARGKTLGLVGESGCGKTTVGRSILRLVEPTGGRVSFDGLAVRDLRGRDLRNLRRRMQVVFQDPYGSLNPRMTVRALIEEGLIIHRLGSARERVDRVVRAMERTGLSRQALERYPHEFSGGQRQRIAIARALVLEPDFLVLDEPISALELREHLGLTYLFISHDLSVVEHVSDEVAVMYLGRIVERATAAALYAQPLHPYTLALFSAVPTVDPARRRRRIVLVGDVPSPSNPPRGCRFHPRCPLAESVCREVDPPMVSLPEHAVHCHVAARELARAGGNAAVAAATIAALLADQATPPIATLSPS